MRQQASSRGYRRSRAPLLRSRPGQGLSSPPPIIGSCCPKGAPRYPYPGGCQPCLRPALPSPPSITMGRLRPAAPGGSPWDALPAKPARLATVQKIGVGLPLPPSFCPPWATLIPAVLPESCRGAGGGMAGEERGGRFRFRFDVRLEPGKGVRERLLGVPWEPGDRAGRSRHRDAGDSRVLPGAERGGQGAAGGCWCLSVGDSLGGKILDLFFFFKKENFFLV